MHVEGDDRFLNLLLGTELTLYLTGYTANPLPDCSRPAPMLSMVVTAITNPYLKMELKGRRENELVATTHTQGLHSLSSASPFNFSEQLLLDGVEKVWPEVLRVKQDLMFQGNLEANNHNIHQLED